MICLYYWFVDFDGSQIQGAVIFDTKAWRNGTILVYYVKETPLTC